MNGGCIFASLAAPVDSPAGAARLAGAAGTVPRLRAASGFGEPDAIALILSHPATIASEKYATILRISPLATAR